VGIGDDAAVVAPERNRLEVLTTDCQVEDVHFDRTFVGAADIGHKALAVNLSDLAALGAVLAIHLGLSQAFALALPLGGLIGGAVAMLAVVALAGAQGGPVTLILAGLAVAMPAVALQDFDTAAPMLETALSVARVTMNGCGTRPQT